MKRNDFLKLLGVSGVAVAISSIIPNLPQRKEASLIKKEAPKIAIDINSISHFSDGGKKITPSEIIRFYNDTGILIYKSGINIHPPIVLSGELEIVKT